MVVDIHRALNQLQTELAEESIDGARTYMLGEGDAGCVRAFMAGINRNSPLKFDHPWLGTTATRSGSKLLIQNDIGVPDAHVLVITVDDTTYYGQPRLYRYPYIEAPQRLQFFQNLFPEPI